MMQIMGDREALRLIIQKHEAIFRYQLEELHRLYRRQRELMDEIGMRQILANNCLSQAHSIVSQTSQTSNRILRKWPDNLSVSTTKVHSPISVLPSPLLTKNIDNKGIWDLRHRADVEEEKQFEEVNGYECGTAKIGEVSSCNRLFIDLNEPIQPDPVSSISSDPKAKCHLETMLRDCHFSGVDKPMSLLDIDLNSVPVNCLSETVSFEGLMATDEEFKVKHSMELFHPLSAKQDDGSMVSFSCKIESPNVSLIDKIVVSNPSSLIREFPIMKSEVDLNIEVIGESLASTDVWDISAPEIDLEAPVSPENMEGSPPRGESEDTVTEKSPPLPQQRKKEPEFEQDVIAAKTLVMISSSDKNQNLDRSNCLHWFAEIVASHGNWHGLENELGKLPEDRGELHIDGNRRREQGAKDNRPIKSLRKTGSLKRNGGRKSSGTVNNQSMLKGWGMLKKRKSGVRHRPSKFLVIC